MGGIALMNLFIAVLTVKYDMANQRALVLFSQQQAHKVIETKAMYIGLRVCKRFLCPWLRDKKKKQTGRVSLLQRSESAMMAAVSSRVSVRRPKPEIALDLKDAYDKFMWVCLPEA